MLVFFFTLASLAQGAESPWRRPLGPAVESLTSEMRSGTLRAGLPAGLLESLASDGAIQIDAVEPIVEQLTSLELEPASFARMAPEKQAETLALALDAAVS